MRLRSSLPARIAVVIALLTATATASAATTIVLQNGVEGYAGCQDTYLDRNEPTTPMGGLEYLWQDGGDTDYTGARAITRFDLSIIPATAHLLSASLYLYGDSYRSYYGSVYFTDCYFLPVTRPWSELEATWQQAAPGEPWNWTAGDPDDAPVCFFDEPVLKTDIDVWARVDVTSFVQSWVDGSVPNYGLVGMTWGQGVGNYAHRFRSAQWPDPVFRPYLEITYEDPGVVSLPPSYLDPQLRSRADLHAYQHLEDQPLDIALSDMVELGFRYVYTGFTVDLHDGEPVAAQLLAGPYLALDDEWHEAITARGLTPVFRIGVSRNGGEPTVQDVYEVARWYAARYAGEVHWFSYCGEVNNGWYEYGTTSCSPEHVTARIVAAAQGVKEVDPDNKMMLTQLGSFNPYEYIKECLPYGLAEATDQWGYGTVIEYFWHERWYWPRYLRRWVILAATEAERVGHPISCQREGMIQADESAPTHRVQGTMVARKTLMDFVAGMVPSEWYKLYDRSPENYQIVADDLVTRYEAFYVLKNLNTYLDPGRWSGVYCGIGMDQPYQRFAFRDDDGSLIMALWDGGAPPGEDLVAPTLTQVTCLDYGHVYADLVDPMSGAVTPIRFVSASGRLTFSDIPVVDYPVLLRLRHGARGSITDAADGTPIAGAVLQAWQAGSLKAQGTSDVHGRYWIPLSPGAYSLVCECVDRASQSRSVTVVPEASISADFALAMVPHTLSVTAWALPSTVASGARTSLSASATDSQGHSIACSWSDGGAGGSFSPSAAAQNPSYIAPVNVSVNDRTVTLTVIAACNGPTPLTNSGSTTLTVQAVPPSSLAATAVSVSQINLAWRDNSADETGFKIERKTGATGTYAQIATVAANVVSYANTGLTANILYYYRVRAYNATGNSPYSNEASATTFITNPPSGLTATALVTGQINLAWTDNATTETGFKIERKTGATGTYAQIATVGANVVTYQNTGLAASTSYYYRVRAYNATGNSPYSNEAHATTPAVSAPSTLTATAPLTTQINLAWRDNASNETGFKIERKTGSTGTYAQIATVGANVVTYTNSGRTANTKYYYRVRAYTATANSAYSNEVSATTPIVSPPTTLVATALSTTQIKLTWRDNATNETGFKIERKTGSTGTWAQIATPGANVVTYTNSGRTANTKYYYRVRAYNASGNSPYSNEANATTFIVNPPSTLAATALATNKIRLTWKDNATNETGFKIERKTGASGTYAQIATVAANIVTYTNTGLTTKTTYYYRVRAYNATGNSPYSNEAHATTP